MIKVDSIMYIARIIASGLGIFVVETSTYFLDEKYFT